MAGQPLIFNQQTMFMKMNYKMLLLAGGLAAGFMSCQKNLLENNIPQRFPDVQNEGFIKFIHAYASRTPAVTSGAGPQMILYLNDTTKRLNGAISAATAFGFGPFGGQFPARSTDTANATSTYVSVPKGTAMVVGVLARFASGVPAPIRGDTVFQAPINIEPGKYYTAFFGDTLQNPSLTVVPDDFGNIAEGKYKIRLANFLAWPGDIHELYSVREGRVIQGGIGYKKVGEFIELNVNIRSDTIIVRKVSGPSPVANGFPLRTFNGFSPIPKRAYTFFTRGKQMTGTSTVFQNSSTRFTTNL
jgi:hypothetical protein